MDFFEKLLKQINKAASTGNFTEEAEKAVMIIGLLVVLGYACLAYNAYTEAIRKSLIESGHRRRVMLTRASNIVGGIFALIVLVPIAESIEGSSLIIILTAMILPYGIGAGSVLLVGLIVHRIINVGDATDAKDAATPPDSSSR